jgi:hypothetical protein
MLVFSRSLLPCASDWVSFRGGITTWMCGAYTGKLFGKMLCTDAPNPT